MSTINTIQLNNIASSQLNNGIKPPELLQPIQPILESNNVQNTYNASAPLLTDDDIDKFIESQKNQQNQQVEQTPQPQYANSHTNDLPDTPPQENDAEIKIDFNLASMNANLEEIIKSTKGRINQLVEQQNKVSARVNLLEKFIKLDEKELAIEINKPSPNDQKIRGIRNSLVNQTELFGTTMDILLKFEGSIQSWTKTLLDIEKDKVSAYQKIKSVNKEQTNAETDITEVMNALNHAIKTNPNTIFSTADNVLSIQGYSGKKFNS